MRRLLALTAMLGFLPSAQAADDHKADFSHNAEYRVRYQYDQNIAGKETTKPKTKNTVNHRFKFGTMFKASEKFTAGLTLLHNADWGSDDLGVSGANTTGDSSGSTHTGISNSDNMILVQEAFGSWMVNDSFMLKFGRMGLQIGDGSVVALNDWEATPNSFEGVLGTYEMEFARLNVFAIKFAEYTQATSGATDGDPEANSYGISFDLKTMPAWLKMLNVHVIKNNKDTTPSATATTPINAQLGQDTLRYGIALTGDTMNIDYHAVYAAVTGDFKSGTGTVTKFDADSNMMQFDLGYSMPNVMNSRIGITYHQDSGDSSSTDTEVGTYDSFYYEKHSNAGLMDVVDWGNLTYWSIGYTLMPTDSLKVGLHYHMFELTESNDSPVAGVNGGSIMSARSAGNTETKLGNEIDLEAEHKYDGGFSIVARFGMFTPGDYLKHSTINKDDTYNQFFVEGKMSF